MKIAVGLSGGVDSSVTALLLKQQGWNVIGIFMKNWEEDDTSEYCAAAQDRQDAEAVCERLGIPFYAVNFASEYWDSVFEHFLAEYQAGRTPNPDILCNREIKFTAFLNYAQQLGADAIATGHYAGVEEEEDRFRLMTAADHNKDQTYFLYTLGQAQLSKVKFPLQSLLKSEVRILAEEAGLGTAKKKDSTGICFIGERRFKSFLSAYLPHQPGPIVNEQGKVIGQHDGLMYYTLGQRQGLHIGGQQGAEEAPWYVAAKHLADQTLVVVQGANHPLLFQSMLNATQLHWTHPLFAERETFSCTAKIRYRQAAQACRVQRLEKDLYRVDFPIPQRAVTPGQSIVFYEGDECIGGGVIA